MKSPVYAIDGGCGFHRMISNKLFVGNMKLLQTYSQTVHHGPWQISRSSCLIVTSQLPNSALSALSAENSPHNCFGTHANSITKQPIANFADIRETNPQVILIVAYLFA